MATGAQVDAARLSYDRSSQQQCLGIERRLQYRWRSRRYRGFRSDGFAEVEVIVVFDGTGFEEITVLGFFDTTDVIEVRSGRDS